MKGVDEEAKTEEANEERDEGNWNGKAMIDIQDARMTRNWGGVRWLLSPPQSHMIGGHLKGLEQSEYSNLPSRLQIACMKRITRDFPFARDTRQGWVSKGANEVQIISYACQFLISFSEKKFAHTLLVPLLWPPRIRT